MRIWGSVIDTFGLAKDRQTEEDQRTQCGSELQLELAPVTFGPITCEGRCDEDGLGLFGLGAKI